MLSLFRFSPMELEEEIRWPADWRLALAFSGVRAEKTREALEKYNMVSRRARAAVDAYNARQGTRFTNLGEAVRAGARPGSWRGLDDGAVPGLGDRVRQFVAEETRIIPGALRTLRAGDTNGFGRQLTASHRASRRGLWNIAPEVNALQVSALSLGACGASGFGGGFGGSILALVRRAEADRFVSQWRARFRARYPGRTEADFSIARPGPGIEVWTPAGPCRLVDRIFSAC
jgi:galactokinase